MKYNRLQRLLAAKQAEFDALAPSMQDKLRLAFNHAKDEAWKVSFFVSLCGFQEFSFYFFKL